MHGHLESSLRRLFVFGTCLLVPLVFAVGVAWACAPGNTGIPPASPPSVAVSPASGLAGSTTTVTARSFAPSAVEIHWDQTNGPLLASGTGPGFSMPVTIPAGVAGAHHLVAFTRTGGNPDPAASTPFQVTPTPTPVGEPTSFAPPVGSVQSPPSFSSPPPDTLGPAIAQATLSRQNITHTVTRNGEVRLFCGRYQETVAGLCGAQSTSALTQVRTSRRQAPARSVLRLAARPFSATAGRSVLVKFVLSKASMKMLRAAKKVRMRGNVEVRDASGNVTRASFGLTLKAPAPGR